MVLANQKFWGMNPFVFGVFGALARGVLALIGFSKLLFQKGRVLLAGFNEKMEKPVVS